MSKPVLKVLLLSRDRELQTAIGGFWKHLDTQITVVEDIKGVVEKNRKCIYHVILLDYCHENLSVGEATPIENTVIYRPPILHLLSGSESVKEIDTSRTDRFCFSSSYPELRSSMASVLRCNELIEYKELLGYRDMA